MLVKQTFCFEEKQLNDLEMLSKESGVPKTVLVRRALDNYLGAKEDDRRREWLQRNHQKTA